jgi:hypothetical protein
MSGIDVEINSPSLGYNINTMTDSNGYYEFNHLESANDYIISVFDVRYGTIFYYTDGNETITDRYKATPLTPTDPPLTDINIEIRLSNTISGQVITDKGDVVEGLWVRAEDVNDELNSRIAKTDEFGHYTIIGLDNVYQYVEIQPTAYPYQAYSLSTTKAMATPVTVNSMNIDFILMTGSYIQGTVTNSDNNPLYKVSVYLRSSQLGISSQTLTDESGQYTLTNLPFATDYVLYADAIDYPIQFYDRVKTSASASHVNLSYGSVGGIDFVLDKGAVIHGNVYIDSLQNEARSGIMVNIFSESSQTGNSVPTDTNGRFEIAGLLADASDYIISILNEQYIHAFYNSNYPNTTTYKLAEAEGVSPDDTDRNLLLKKGYVVSGSVSASDASIVENFTIELYSEDSGGFGITNVTDNNLINAPYRVHNIIGGTYSIDIQASGYVSQQRTLSINGNTTGIDFILDLPSRSIGGTIYNIESGRNVQISACEYPTTTQDSCQTAFVSGSGNISYLISGLKNAIYYVGLISVDYPNQIYDQKLSPDEANKINLSNGNHLDIHFTLPDRIPEVSGTITFPDQAIQGDTVIIDAFSDTDSGNSTSVVYSGQKIVSYRIIGLQETKYFVLASSDTNSYLRQYFDGVYEKNQAFMIDTADEITDNQVNFVMTYGATISGQIRYPDYSSAGANIFVMIQSKANPDFSSDCRTDADGKYMISGLNPRSDYIVSAEKTDFPIYYYHPQASVLSEQLAETVSVMDTNLENISITIHSGSSISGKVRDTNGIGIKNIYVHAGSDSVKFSKAVSTDYRGIYFINGLIEANDYVIEVAKQENQPYIPKTRTDISSGSSEVNFILDIGFKVSGEVISEDMGLPIVNTKVILKSSSNNWNKETFVADDGSFVLQGIPAGNDYILTAIPPASEPYIIMTIKKDMSIQSDMSLMEPIELSPSITIKGKVVDINNFPIIYAVVSAFSAQVSTKKENILTSENGQFIITNIPNASDYVLEISYGTYQKKQVDAIIGEEMIITLVQAGNITGQVFGENGELGWVTVVLKSESMPNFSMRVLTDFEGRFSFTQVPVNDNYGETLSDYYVEVKADGYPDKTKSSIEPNGDLINITLDRSSQNQIKGTVIDSENSNMPPGGQNKVNIYVFTENSVYIKMEEVSQDGNSTFIIDGLTPGLSYELDFYPVGGDNFIEYESGLFETGKTYEFKFQQGTW